jgi:endonuclease/exonuclease/phosphatase family metal-dependent hydrolase
MNLGKGLIKILLFAANLVVVLLLIVSLLATRISPEKVLLPAYSTLLFPLIVLFNIGFVIFWLSFRKWFFLLSLLTLLVSFNIIKNTFPVNFKQSVDRSKEAGLTLLTYNTHANGFMAKHTKEKPNPVIQYMLDKDPDVLCIQEYSARTNDEFLSESDLMKIFEKYPFKHIQYKVEAGWSKSGVATFSKYPIVGRILVEFKSRFNTTIATDIRWKEKTLRIYNCHLESNNLTENDKIMAFRLKDNLDTENIKGTTMHLSRKLGAAYRIRGPQADIVSKNIASSPYPVLVVGDFNDLPSSYAYTKVRGKMKDAFVERGFGLGWTFSESILKFRIDHIFYDDNIELIDFKLDNKVRYSDHYPLYCKINY